MKNSYLFLFLMLISACTIKSGHVVFNERLDDLSSGDRSISDLENLADFVNDGDGNSTLIKKELTKDGQYMKFYYGRPARVIYGTYPHKYGNTTCRYHFVVNMATSKIVDWGYDMKEGDLGYDLCRTYK